MFTKNFKDLTKKDVGIAGGKGASLGEMSRVGLPVPPGFVVLASAFERFLEETDLDVEIEAIMHKVKHHDMNSVEVASEKIRDLIHDVKFPKDLGVEIFRGFKDLKSPYVAVRSSATAEDSSEASWAGELESYLNVTQKNLLESVQKCWSSLFTPRAIFYRFEIYPPKSPLKKRGNGMGKVSVAVVVQKMVQSEISGITFTVHPVTKDYDQMVIEAAYGLGEAIVGGMVTPDTYVVHTKDWCILDSNIGKQEMMIIGSGGGTKKSSVPIAKQEKQKLKNSEILQLAKVCKGIEKHYKKPQDIEWAYEKGRFYITQSRPITTL